MRIWLVLSIFIIYQCTVTEGTERTYADGPATGDGSQSGNQEMNASARAHDQSIADQCYGDGLLIEVSSPSQNNPGPVAAERTVMAFHLGEDGWIDGSKLEFCGQNPIAPRTCVGDNGLALPYLVAACSGLNSGCSLFQKRDCGCYCAKLK